MKTNTKAAPKKTATKEKTPAVDHTADMLAFLDERIADGGATTDHLRAFREKIQPTPQEAQN